MFFRPDCLGCIRKVTRQDRSVQCTRHGINDLTASKAQWKTAMPEESGHGGILEGEMSIVQPIGVLLRIFIIDS